jgi:hypothetical protein
VSTVETYPVSEVDAARAIIQAFETKIITQDEAREALGKLAFFGELASDNAGRS